VACQGPKYATVHASCAMGVYLDGARVTMAITTQPRGLCAVVFAAMYAVHTGQRLPGGCCWHVQLAEHRCGECGGPAGKGQGRG
jgi:hypothetical protein